MSLQKISEMVIAMNNEVDAIPDLSEPQGMFHRRAIINTGNIKIDSDELDIEFDIPFSDSSEIDEAEISVYNLSQNTISQLKYNQDITVTAGYGSDTGIIFSGRIISTSAKRNGNDKKTTITAVDSQSLEDRTLENIAYQSGVKASYILKDLIGKTGIPISIFNPIRDYTYKESMTVDGSINESIKKYAEICGVSAYIHKGKWYVRSIKDGDDINFNVSVDTGLINSPEEFEEEINSDEYKETIKGYKIKMLLQHRIAVASVINLKSRDVSGTFRVRDGQHSFSGDDFITEFNCI